MRILESVSWIYGTLIVFSAFFLFSLVGILVIHKTLNMSYLRANHDVAVCIFNNFGVLYSVLLGFTIVNVQQRFDKIEDTAQIEASYLYELYRDAQMFMVEDTTKIRSAVTEYIQSVIAKEWSSMSSGRSEPDTEEAFKRLWQSYYSVNLSTKSQELWYAESIGKLNQLMSARLSRLMGSGTSLGNEMWTLLILGGVVIMVFTCFFGVESLTSHILLATVLSAACAFSLFFIYSLDTAFSGSVSVPPEALNRVLDTIRASR